MKVWNDSFHILYRFNDSKIPWQPFYWIILWQMETYFVNQKREIFTWSTGGGYQEYDWWYPASCWARAKENIFNLFDILKKRWQYYTHMRLYYRCVKVWMVEIWLIFGQSSISPNFHVAKVSLHTVCYKTQNRKRKWIN